MGESALQSPSHCSVDGIFYDPTTLYSYDYDGNLTTVTEPNGQTTTYTYNNLNQLTNEMVTVDDGKIDVFEEHYDLNDNGSKADAIDTRYTVVAAPAGPAQAGHPGDVLFNGHAAAGTVQSKAV